MGVPKFFRYISERYPCLSELAREHSVSMRLCLCISVRVRGCVCVCLCVPVRALCVCVACCAKGGCLKGGEAVYL